MNGSDDQSSQPSGSASMDAFTTPARERMFRKIIYSPEAFFRNQQKGEADLSETEKHTICSNSFSENPVQFLARYHRQLDSEDVGCFEDALSRTDKDDVRYELGYYLQELAKKKSGTKSGNQPDAITKNRRYAALKKLISNGDYFSDYEMRERDPLLYDQMIGQYQTESEQQEAFHSGDRQASTLSSVLLDMYDAKELSQRRRVQMAQEATSDRQPRRNEEDASDEEEEMEDEDEEVQEDFGHAATGQPPRHARLSEAEKQGLRADFIREMHERFLDGRDVGFDYMAVDNNPEYDLVEQQARDQEDRYFDDEDPAECEDSQEQNHDT